MTEASFFSTQSSPSNPSTPYESNSLNSSLNIPNYMNNLIQNPYSYQQQQMQPQMQQQMQPQMQSQMQPQLQAHQLQQYQNPLYSQILSQTQMQFQLQKQILEYQIQQKQYENYMYQLQHSMQPMHQQNLMQPTQPQPSIKTFASVVEAKPEKLEKLEKPIKIQIYETKKEIFKTITQIVLNNCGKIFGNYVVYKIFREYICDTFFKYLLEDIKQKDIILTDEEKYMEFHNPKCYPQLQSRIKLPKHIEILINSNKYTDFIYFITNAFVKTGYSTEEKYRGDITKITEYSNIIQEPNTMFLNTISIIVKLGEIDFIIKMNVFISTKTDSSHSNMSLQIPYGLFTNEKYYLTLIYNENGSEKYEMQEGIAESTPPTETTLAITTIKNQIINNITTFMPYYDYSQLNKLLDKTESSTHTLDFNLSGGNYSDFWITNKRIKVIGTKCENCKIEFPSHNKRAITKCCKHSYHFDCLLETYDVNGVFNCETCKIQKPDTLSKNKDILLSLLGYFE